MEAPDYAGWETRIRAWAETRPDLRAILAVGSRARAQPPPDAWADLDLILYTIATEFYQSGADWLVGLSEVWAATLGATSHDPEWLVLFGDGAKIDFVIAGVPENVATVQDIVDSSPYQAVLGDGVRVLADKLQRSAAALQLPVAQPLSPPTSREFCHVVHAGWLEAARAAHYLARHDLWRAQATLNGALRSHLLTLLTWHAVSQERRPWPGGRRLADWADPLALAALPETFAGYDSAAMWRALLATVDLSTRLADEIASRLMYVCDDQSTAVRAWLAEMWNAAVSAADP